MHNQQPVTEPAPEEATRQVKPGKGINQAVTQVKVLSPVIINVKEVDSFLKLEDIMIWIDMVRDRLLLRGLSPRHEREGMR